MFNFFKKKISERKEKKESDLHRMNQVREQETLLINNIKGIINHCDKADAYFGWMSAVATFGYKDLTVHVYPKDNYPRAYKVLILTSSGKYLTENAFGSFYNDVTALFFERMSKVSGSEDLCCADIPSPESVTLNSFCFLQIQYIFDIVQMSNEDSQ